MQDDLGQMLDANGVRTSAWKARECGHHYRVGTKPPKECPDCEHNALFRDELIDDAMARARAVVRREE